MSALLVAAGVLGVGVALAVAYDETRVRAIRTRVAPSTSTPPRRARLAAGVTAAIASLVVGGAVAAAAVAAVLVLLPAAGRRWAAKRATERYDADLAPALDAVGRSLRAGATLTQALEEASVLGGPVTADLAAAVARARRGGGIVEALDAWSAAATRPAVRLVASALSLAAEVGGSQARAVDGLAATVRSRQHALAEARAQATQARLSGLVIAAAPLAFGLLTGAGDARTLRFLLATPLGLFVLLSGLALDGVGFMWMRRLSRRPALIAEGGR